MGTRDQFLGLVRACVWGAVRLCQVWGVPIPQRAVTHEEPPRMCHVDSMITARAPGAESNCKAVLEPGSKRLNYSLFFGLTQHKDICILSNLSC